jgi:hypothetical protein
MTLYEKYKSEKCGHCGQSLTYLLVVDRGTVDIVKAISVAIRRKGINVIHPRKEIEINGRELSYKEMVTEGRLTSNQVGNLSRPGFHGLIAKVKGHPGNYALTDKGMAFLRGASIPKFAIISKTSKCQIGYWEPLKYQCALKDFRPDQEYWEMPNWEIREGRVIKEMPIPKVEVRETAQVGLF